ncbi:hypothetical protein ACWEQ0_28300 [Nocardia thailandica]
MFVAGEDLELVQAPGSVVEKGGGGGGAGDGGSATDAGGVGLQVLGDAGDGGAEVEHVGDPGGAGGVGELDAAVVEVDLVDRACDLAFGMIQVQLDRADVDRDPRETEVAGDQGPDLAVDDDHLSVGAAFGQDRIHHAEAADRVDLLRVSVEVDLVLGTHVVTDDQLGGVHEPGLGFGRRWCEHRGVIAGVGVGFEGGGGHGGVLPGGAGRGQRVWVRRRTLSGNSSSAPVSLSGR